MLRRPRGEVRGAISCSMVVLEDVVGICGGWRNISLCSSWVLALQVCEHSTFFSRSAHHALEGRRSQSIVDKHLLVKMS